MKETKKHHIILLTTWYPPRHSIAVNRMLAFAKYIDKDYFDVDVVTLESVATLESEVVLEGVSVHRLPNKTFLRRAKFDKPAPFVWHKLKALYNRVLSVFVKKEYSDWQKRAEKKVLSLLQSYGKDVTVISSYEPIEPHIVAINLKKIGCVFHWVADCRDEITQNPTIAKGLRKLYLKAERQMLMYADLITTVSNPILQGFSESVPPDSSHRPLFAEIRNGYDFDIATTAQKNDVFTITYTGTFYANIKPYTFFKALRIFLEDKPDANVRVNLVGVGNSIIIPEYLTNVVFPSAKISHEKTLFEMQKSDCLLLILPKQKRKGVYSGKLFEYLGCHKHILAVVDPEDVAAQLIKQCNAGYVADFDDINAIKQGLEAIYALWLNNQHLEMNEQLIQAHHRKKQVKKLNDLILSTFYMHNT